MFVSVKAGKLNVSGALTGGLLGFAIFLGAGFIGLLMLAVFFVTGSFVTAWKLNYKVDLGLAEQNKGKRTAGQAFANAGTAGLLGMAGWLFPEKADVFNLMLAASFASATADTVSSELGNVYGRRFYNILTLKTDTRGLDGVISVEGTLLGVLGSGLIGLLYGLGFGWNWGVLCVILAGILGNITDSVLGATVERKQYLTNDAVNFLNTLIAALLAPALHAVFR